MTQYLFRNAVFICGFYSDIEVSNLGVLKEACDKSVTKLVIFPAHNENASVIANAQKKFPTLFCLNWKAELDSLIARGVDRWDLCFDDQHDHSSPLAGYVGAHMIYRAIYGEMPTKPMQQTLSQSYINRILDNYTHDGDMHIFDEDTITYLD